MQAAQRMHCSVCRSRLSWQESPTVRCPAEPHETAAAHRPCVTPVHSEVYGFIRSPVADRASTCSITSRSWKRGITFSMPASVIMVRGSVRHMRPLPSDSTTATDARLRDQKVRPADRRGHASEISPQIMSAPPRSAPSDRPTDPAVPSCAQKSPAPGCDSRAAPAQRCATARLAQAAE